MLVAYSKNENRIADIKITIKDKKLSICGTIGMFTSEDNLNDLVNDYWDGLDLESEYGYLCDDVIGTEPDDYDIDSFIDHDSLPDINDEDYDDAYDDAYDEAYGKANEILQTQRSEYLESLKTDLMNESYPYEIYRYIDDYVMTLDTCGQCDDEIRNMMPVIDSGNFNFIMSVWKKYHLKKITPEIEDTLRSIMNRYNESQIVSKLIDLD